MKFLDLLEINREKASLIWYERQKTNIRLNTDNGIPRQMVLTYENVLQKLSDSLKIYLLAGMLKLHIQQSYKYHTQPCLTKRSCLIYL